MSFYEWIKEKLGRDLTLIVVDYFKWHEEKEVFLLKKNYSFARIKTEVFGIWGVVLISHPPGENDRATGYWSHWGLKNSVESKFDLGDWKFGDQEAKGKRWFMVGHWSQLMSWYWIASIGPVFAGENLNRKRKSIQLDDPDNNEKRNKL